MHDSCTVFGSDKISAEHLEKLISIARIDLRTLSVRKKRFISQIFEFFSLLTIDKAILVWRFEVFFQKLFCEDIILLRSGIINRNIVDVLSDR